MISIIVAIYQAESYLHRCVDSILNQTYKNIELLLVNDGSTDRSGAICDEYAQQDSRVKVFHKQNEGVSATRQFGLDHAIGEYTIYVDPDDWIEPDMIECLYTKAIEEKADMVMCDMSWDYPDHSEISRENPSDLSATTILSEIYFRISSSLCNKLIRRDCYIQYNIRYTLGMKYLEDLYILLQLLSHPIRIEYIGKAFYHYDRYTNTSSLTRCKDVEEYKMAVDYIDEHIDHEVYKDIDRLKRDVIFEAYYNHLPTERFTSFYPDQHRAIFQIGLSHPTQEWRNIEVGLALYGFPILGKLYAKTVTNLSLFKRRIVGK